jgi:hypothetical protein
MYSIFVKVYIHMDANAAQLIITDCLCYLCTWRLEWAKRLQQKHIGVDVHCMHPGWAATEGLETAMKDFFDSNLRTLRSPAEGDDPFVFLGTAPQAKVGEGGDFWFDRQAVRTHMPLAWTRASEQEREDIWSNSAQYVGGLSFAEEEEDGGGECSK